jgi:hypothetical protein
MKVLGMFITLCCLALLPGSVHALPGFASSAALSSAAVAQDHDHHGNDWEHDQRLQGRNPGFRHGFRDGATDGERDREAGRRWHFGPGYKHPDRGYRDEFGDKRDYEHEDREGYEQGYKEAYEHR